MRLSAQLAREISYATSASTRRGRALVKVMENTTGRPALIRRAVGYEAEVAAGRDFWAVMCERYGIRPQITAGTIETIPRQGPLIVIANHPYGILDGLMMGRLLSERRNGEFKIMAHQVFGRAPALERILLPIDFSETREAAERNLATRAQALRYLAAGGAIGIFPGGTVSTAATPFGLPRDPIWRSFTAKMIARSDATVIPLFFEGHNSRLFQLASHLHYTLRLGLLIREFRARVGTDVSFVVGEPISRSSLEAFGSDAKGLMAFLRRSTYALSRNTLKTDELGFEFEARYRARYGQGSLKDATLTGPSSA